MMEISPTDVLLGRLGRKPVTAEAAGARKKRMKVVKRRLPQALIDHIIAYPYTMEDIPADRLAKRSKFFREFYAESKETADNIVAYQRGLIDQYNTKGYAEEDREVTDDEEETVESKGSNHFYFKKLQSKWLIICKEPT
ncbi:hypothetical protein CFC21_109989 [Triticum aestivum]|nr:hypothetical protein CFC21_109989 [Triticum aestivum]